jgi:hypothetical protein
VRCAAVNLISGARIHAGVRDTVERAGRVFALVVPIVERWFAGRTRVWKACWLLSVAWLQHVTESHCTYSGSASPRGRRTARPSAWLSRKCRRGATRCSEFRLVHLLDLSERQGAAMQLVLIATSSVHS